jgi:uncharacterized hydantoinase/oxoprolinase family protein
MLCADSDHLTDQEILEIATQAHNALTGAVILSMHRVFSNLPRQTKTAFICGSGENVLRRFVKEDPKVFHVESFQDNFGPALSSCACAYALAVLTKEDLIGEQSTRR